MSLVDKLKSRTEKIKKGSRNLIAIGGIVGMLSFGACKSLVNYPPVITSTPVTQVNEEESYNYQVEAKDLNQDILNYSLTQNPNWLSINSDTGIITGTAPNINADETYVIEVNVSDNCGASDTQYYELVVKNNPEPQNNIPAITSSPNTEINEEAYYNYQVEATDADADALTYSLTQKPNWLLIDSNTGLITGDSPPISSDTSYNVIVRVSDGINSSEQSFSILEKNLLDISGRLEDNETDLSQAGIIKVYDNLENWLKTVDVPAGNFDFQLDEVYPEVILQGRMMDGTTDKSYIRTINLNGTQDFSGPIRVVPYDGPLPYDDGLIPGEITEAQFNAHLKDANTDELGTGLRKWDLSYLEGPEQGIEILRYNPLLEYDLETDVNTFTIEEQDLDRKSVV